MRLSAGVCCLGRLLIQEGMGGGERSAGLVAKVFRTGIEEAGRCGFCSRAG